MKTSKFTHIYVSINIAIWALWQTPAATHGYRIHDSTFKSSFQPIGVVNNVCRAESEDQNAGETPTSAPRSNLFEKQYANYYDPNAHQDRLRNDPRWQDIVMEEIAKNRNRFKSDEFLYGELNANDDLNYSHTMTPDAEPTRKSFNYRLSPEGRLKLENRIDFLKRVANSNPGRAKEKRPNLWIVRTSHGNYCELLKKDDDRIKSLVNRVRKYFNKEQLQILVMKIDIKMPLCEIFFEGTKSDLVRVLHARGGTLQYYVVPRFWTRCELLAKNPTLEAKYGRPTAPGLFPQWDEDGFVEEIIDCMDKRPDYALEFRQPNAWQLVPLMSKRDKLLMQRYFTHVHWPTRVRVQKAFEHGIEDYRDVISCEYEELTKTSQHQHNPLDEFLPPADDF